MLGKLVLVIGPSGSGKSTLIKHLREHHPDLIFPVSCTTREKRPGEKEGESYYFVSKEEFEEKIRAGEFLEWALYGGNLYGTLKKEIFEPLEERNIVVREVEVQGARMIVERVPKENLSIIFIDAGSWETLEERIQKRSPMDAPSLKLREERYHDEVSFKEHAHHILYNNGDIEESIAQLEEILKSIREEVGA